MLQNSHDTDGKQSRNLIAEIRRHPPAHAMFLCGGNPNHLEWKSLLVERLSHGRKFQLGTGILHQLVIITYMQASSISLS
jgi:hypothetical protein